MDLLQTFPVLLVDDTIDRDTASGRASRALVSELRDAGTTVITASDLDDASQIIGNTATLSSVLIDWDAHGAEIAATSGGGGLAVVGDQRTETLIETLRAKHPLLPIFVLADHSSVDELGAELLGQIDGYIWKLEDTASFVAGRIEHARREYLDTLLPPFFEALVRFTEDSRYSWHTPGHSGGTAFMKTPVGSALHAFFGENTLRSDLSVSVGELGSLMEHTGPIGAAERNAARIFGADRTMFVTNGTSTANKIVFHSCVRHGDVVLVDRNCHKSIMHAIVMTGAIPVYLHPSRNADGIIGPIPPSDLTAESIAQRLRDHPLVPDGVTRARLAVVTNSTYDGLCYDASAVLDALAESTDRVLFDEAWFAYAHFHPLYAGRHAMGIEHHDGQPVTFATQSTHKLLTAFSQASMVHVSGGAREGVLSAAALEEAFMMHTSTSPQYGIIASLDVAAQTMDGVQGTQLIDDTIGEALAFRGELSAISAQRATGDWEFDVWQPTGTGAGSALEQRDPVRWTLHDGDAWHGYDHVESGHALLDPIKVTVLTPGLARSGSRATTGIPAALVSRFLDERGVVVEKTGAYSFLVLFSLGITRGKAGTLLAELLEFKRLYDSGAPLSTALPRLVNEHRERYETMTLRELGDDLHAALEKTDLTALTGGMYAQLPETLTAPAAAYEHLVSGATTMVPVAELAGRVSSAMVVPYPPGIPVIMPGERFPDSSSALLRYLSASEGLARRFPGFETEIHGIQIGADGGYSIPCLPIGA
jgi:arginine decarboxylase